MSREYFRHAELDFLPGDAYKTRKKPGSNNKVGFEEPVEIMVDADLIIII